jgi:predicted secreted protein
VRRLCLVALLLLLISGCGEEASREGGATGSSPPPPGMTSLSPPGQTPPPPPVAPTIIREADNGETITLAPGSKTLLRLSSEYLWGEPVVSGEAVQLVRADYFQDPGYYEWLVFAERPGAATVAVQGDPVCRDPEPCPPAPFHFRVEIIVD